MVVAGDNPVVFRIYVPVHCTYHDIPPRRLIARDDVNRHPLSGDASHFFPTWIRIPI